MNNDNLIDYNSNSKYAFILEKIDHIEEELDFLRKTLLNKEMKEKVLEDTINHTQIVTIDDYNKLLIQNHLLKEQLSLVNNDKEDISEEKLLW